MGRPRGLLHSDGHPGAFSCTDHQPLEPVRGMTNPNNNGPAGLAMPKPDSQCRSQIVDAKTSLDHGTAGHDQAGQDVVLAGPKAADHGPSRLLLSRLHRGPADPEPVLPIPLTYPGSSPDIPLDALLAQMDRKRIMPHLMSTS
jgi:hypothetical protein